MYIITTTKEDLFSKKRRLKLILEDLLYKLIDVIVSTDKNRPIEKEAMQGIDI